MELPTTTDLREMSRTNIYVPLAKYNWGEKPKEFSISNKFEPQKISLNFIFSEKELGYSFLLFRPNLRMKTNVESRKTIDTNCNQLTGFLSFFFSSLSLSVFILLFISIWPFVFFILFFSSICLFVFSFCFSTSFLVFIVRYVESCLIFFLSFFNSVTLTCLFEWMIFIFFFHFVKLKQIEQMHFKFL